MRHFYRSMLPATILIISTILMSSCSLQENISRPSGVVSGELKGEKIRWPDKTASICWEPEGLNSFFANTAPHKPGSKLNAKSSVYKWEQWLREEYNNRTDFDFDMNGRVCAQNSKGIRILLVDSSDRRVYMFGRQLDGLKNGVIINPAFKNYDWGSICNNPNLTDICVRDDLLHELGHAIGLRHEARRNDSPCDRDQAVLEWVSIPVGLYDPASIMNYCAAHRNKKFLRSATLSEMDIETINLYYDSDFNPVIDSQIDSCRKDRGNWHTPYSCCSHAQDAAIPVLGERAYPTCRLGHSISLPDPRPVINTIGDDRKKVLNSSFTLELLCHEDGISKADLEVEAQKLEGFDFSNLLFRSRAVRNRICKKVILIFSNVNTYLELKLDDDLRVDSKKTTKATGQWVKYETSQARLDRRKNLDPEVREIKTLINVDVEIPQSTEKLELSCKTGPSDLQVVRPRSDDSAANFALDTSFRFQNKDYQCFQIIARIPDGKGYRFLKLDFKATVSHNGKAQKINLSKFTNTDWQPFFPD